MVKVISPTIQEFNGERFYLCGNYFQHKGKRLHVAVWRFYNGDIPKGYHVHHKDQNRANNELDNLELVESYIHISRHSSSRVEYNQKHIKDMRELASEWHGSEAGRAWHSVHAKETWENMPEHEYVCTSCGKKFTSRHIYGEQNTFCSNACKTYYRAHSGIDDVERVCPVCGKTFKANKYSKKECCSRECAVKKRWNK